jgi:hypothetical protein
MRCGRRRQMKKGRKEKQNKEKSKEMTTGKEA